MQKYIINEKLDEPIRFDFTNIEGYIIPIVVNGKKMVLKKFPNNSTCLNNKVYTIEYLDRFRNLFDDRFILPSMLAYDDDVVGYTMNYVDNVNLEKLLKSYNFSLNQKIGFLKEIGKILEYCKKIRKNIPFFIGDLHVNNFIYNKSTKRINVCDLDSSKIGDNDPFCSRYLTCSRGMKNLDFKYLKNDKTYIPNENSDLFCYNMLILDFLYDGLVEFMTKEEFYDYLNYLDRLHLINKELLDSFSRIYSDEDNINPYDLLDGISKESLEKAHNVTYQFTKMKLY